MDSPKEQKNFDNYLNLKFDYDKRNQKYQTTSGFFSNYDVSLPILSDTNTLTNNYNYKIFKELYENNVSTFAFSLRGASSLSGDDIKLSERLYIPGRKLRGFESGKIGPKDGSDYIGGNYVSTINATTTIVGPEDVLISKDVYNPINTDNRPPIIDKITIFFGLFDRLRAIVVGIISIPVMSNNPTIFMDIAIKAASKIVKIALTLSGFMPSASASS